MEKFYEISTEYDDLKNQIQDIQFKVNTLIRKDPSFREGLIGDSLKIQRSATAKFVDINKTTDSHKQVDELDQIQESDLENNKDE